MSGSMSFSRRTEFGYP